MGSTCGGVANACCSTDLNVDIRNQVEGDHSGSRGAIQGSAKKIKGKSSFSQQKQIVDLPTTLSLPPGHPDRMALEKVLNLVAAVIRGFLSRQRVRKIKFINRVTGKKAHSILQQELLAIPQSHILVVNLKEMEFGQLKLSKQELAQIQQNRNYLQYKSSVQLQDGQIYSGLWDQNSQQKEGYGLQVWPDGSKYEGNWSANMASGKGRFILADGDIYQGNWINDKAHGDGSYFYAEGAVYQGGWIEDKQEGHGREEWPDGSYYEGSYLRGKKHGNGTFQWADGAKYNGQWKDNKMDGTGEFKWSDGRVYVGEYANDKKHGQGTYKWPDGRFYEGRFYNGKQHGKGMYRQNNGQDVYGLWVRGKKSIICKTFDEYRALNDDV